jgi:aspartate-semialdehyde dehydrogenase
MSEFALSKKHRIGIVGATGAVGIEIIKCLFKRSFPVDSLHLFASAKSAGKVVNTDYGEITVQLYTVESARNCHFVFLAVTGEFALENAKLLIEGDGPIVIDNSSAFRYYPEIPLVVL